ncbi:hypothetical protein [Methylovirgula ligni]|uniref:hypothetical protein n=1 Tax=Methylovirgula ligni TaxID=569860 RepID=UPI001010167C|nr:hypothetical protein [Methylovirgula ligni]
MAYIGATTSTTAGGTFTFSGVNLGHAYSNRIVLIGIEGGYGSTNEHNINTVTVGGSSATLIVQALGGSTQTEVSGIAAIALATGTTANIVVTYAGTISRSTIVVWTMQRSSITKISSQSATNSATLSFTLTGNSGGVAVVMGGSTVSSGTYSATASGFTVDSTGNYTGATNDGWIAGHVSPTTTSNAIGTTTAALTASRAALAAVSF